MSREYKQLSMEERSLLQTQLSMDWARPSWSLTRATRWHSTGLSVSRRK